MLSNILVATDLSEASNQVLECVKGLRRVGARQAVLVHVLDVRHVGGLYLALKKLRLPDMEAQKSALEKAGLETEVEIPYGLPYYEINRLAREHGCGLIVIGSHGDSPIKGMLLGSVAHSLLENAVFPILLVRSEITEAGDLSCSRVVCQDLFHHILHPTDFSDVAERAFQYLEKVVSETKSAVTLLHVQDKTRLDPHLKHRLEEFNRTDTVRLERRREHLLSRGASAVAIEVLYGSPKALILERARRKDFSLILMGTQGRGYIHEIVLGSVAHSVARHAPLPVLFVPVMRSEGDKNPL
jgi:nucleotide-binding universal stress UspA family protein